jgi:hypothetical protein
MKPRKVNFMLAATIVDEGAETISLRKRDPAVMRRHRANRDGQPRNHDPGNSKLISSVTNLMSDLLAVSLA